MSNILFPLLALLISLIGGKFLIPELKKLDAGQSVRDDIPESHLAKDGTPTIGGLIFLLPIILVTIISGNLNSKTIPIIISLIGFGAVGFIDDYIKVVKKRNLGLTAKQKLLLQFVVAAIVIASLRHFTGINNEVYVPILNRHVDFGIFATIILLIVIVGSANAVNLTDGLDGLSSGVTIFYMMFMGFVSFKMNERSLVEFSNIVVFSLIGFLFYNKYPAKVFMGDTGSLALGGMVATIAIVLDSWLILPIAGGVYVIEALSVIIQVVSFKTRGKRVFLMSPLHHHFEKKGWKETKVVIVFCIAEILLCILAGLLLMVRW